MKTTYPALIITLLSIVGPAGATPSFDQWVDDITAEWVRANPQLATQSQYFSGAEQDALDRQLILSGAFGLPYGVKAAEAQAALARQDLDALRQFPTASLTASQRTSAALLKWSFEDTIAAARYARYQFVFEQMGGLQLGLVNFLTQTHPIRNRRDCENYLARLALVGPRIDEGIAEARAAADAGILPPRFIVQRTIEQLDGFLAAKPADNVFVAMFITRMDALGAAIPAENRRDFADQAERQVQRAIIPAYQRIRALLVDQLPRTTDDAGVWRLPHGDEAYAQALARYTTTSLTADEIHAIGQREVTRIENEMDTILRQLGYAEGSIQARYEKLNLSLLPPSDPDPRPALVAQAERVVRDAENRAGLLFDLRPKAPVVVRREPAFSERTAAAHYSPPAPDGTRPGIYWLPLADLGSKVPWIGAGFKSTAYHDAVPGHHFQLSVQQESTELPRFRKLRAMGFISAYGEGWALYTERLAAENGWYDGDLPGRLGYLALQLFRARRLVADTGLHAMKWTRQQAIDFGFTAAETERYVVWPGQACSYMIGELRIVELREKARAALGPKFSIKEFHNVVLRGGTVPLDVLAQEVDEWIAAGK